MYHFENGWIGELVINERTTALDPHQQRAFQLFEVMGDKRLRESQFFDYAPNRFLSLAYAQKYAESVFVGETFCKKGN